MLGNIHEIYKRNGKDFKISIWERRDISEQGKKNIRGSKKNVKKVFHYVETTSVCTGDICTKDKLAKWLYTHCGATTEGTEYRLLYFRKVNHWSRRFARLIWIKLWDTEIGEYRYKVTRNGNISRFGWWQG
jgi:hypothetical protein